MNWPTGRWLVIRSEHGCSYHTYAERTCMLVVGESLNSLWIVLSRNQFQFCSCKWPIKAQSQQSLSIRNAHCSTINEFLGALVNHSVDWLVGALKMGIVGLPLSLMAFKYYYYYYYCILFQCAHLWPYQCKIVGSWNNCKLINGEQQQEQEHGPGKGDQQPLLFVWLAAKSWQSGFIETERERESSVREWVVCCDFRI